MTGPPIPASCAARPVTPDGLVIPFGNVQLADGGCDFRSHHHSRWLHCWQRSACQVCGRPPTHPMVMLCGPRQLAQLLFDEPPLHPACAKYVTTACPMVAGDRARYRVGDPVSRRQRGARCYDPECDCGGWVPTPGITPGPGGSDAHEWYAVFVRRYTVAAEPSGRIIGGLCTPDAILRVRLVSEPGRRHEPWLPVDDWLDQYTPPETA